MENPRRTFMEEDIVYRVGVTEWCDKFIVEHNIRF